MKIPMQWIKEYADIPVTAAEYQDAMIMHGTALEDYEEQGKDVQNVVVGRILSVRPHENSDHMVVCQIDVGEEKPLQIVTGAPNVKEGDLVPVAKAGAVLPGGKVIKKGVLRGVESCGMCCSGPELGVPEYLYPSVGDKGLLVFHEDYAPGTDVRPILGIDQTVVNFEILANRPDCLSVWGIGRETAASLGTAFCKPEIAVQTVPGRMEDYVKIDVTDPELCPRYCARVVTNVRIAPSPMWLRKRLHAAGVRSINNVVDITNYVMLETGHPMHAFDLAKVKDHHVIVRRALEGETITTLDGKERALTTDMLMIADQTNATGIAGVMGGEESEITEETKDVMFEIAAFDRTNIRLTTRALGLRTEASGRFERGVNAATCREAADRACQLINLLDAGDVIEDVYDFYPCPKKAQAISASVERINRRTGVAVSGEEMKRILESLGMQVELDGDTLTVQAPAEREDIENEADISEEVLRMYGYDKIKPTQLRGETVPGKRNGHMKVSDKISRILVGKGAYEIRTFSFFGPKELEKLGLPAEDHRNDAIRIRNPLGEDTSIMRTTLVPNMLETLALNQNRNNETALLYEIAPVFEKDGESELPHERPILCIGGFGKDVDFFCVRDIVLDILRQFGIEAGLKRSAEAYLHPGRAAALFAGDDVIAQIGEVHPAVAANFELNKKSVVAEVDLEKVYACRSDMQHIRPVWNFPPVKRDIALVMDERIMVGAIEDLIRREGGELLEKAEVFDIYRGAPMLPGMKSVAFSLTFRSMERTLADDDVNPLMKKILSACLSDFGAALRE